MATLFDDYQMNTSCCMSCSQVWSSNLPDPICAIQWAPVGNSGHCVQELWGLRPGHSQSQWGADHHQVQFSESGFKVLLPCTRLMTIEGNMNPKMSEVDIVPDDDLNTRLKFYVSVQPAFSFRLYSWSISVRKHSRGPRRNNSPDVRPGGTGHGHRTLFQKVIQTLYCLYKAHRLKCFPCVKP